MKKFQFENYRLLKNAIFIAIVLSSYILISGCPKGITIDPSKVSLADYTFETTPNNLNNVGLVFAIDKNKMQIPITLLNLNPVSGNISIPSKSGVKEVSWAALVNFLGTYDINLSAGVGASNSKKITTTFTMDNPKLVRAYLTQLDSAIQQKRDLIGKTLTNQNLQNADIYVIFETIRTKKLTYDFGKSKVGDAELEATFQEIINTNDSIKWDNNDKRSLTFDLKEELNVFSKIIQIDVLRGAAGLDFKRGKILKETELIYLSRKK